MQTRARYLVLAGRAGELELDLPFWVFVDALDEYVHGLDPHRLDSLDADVRAELATVFPSLAGLATGRRTAIQHERYRSHRAVCVLLETLAQTQPVVLVLDDVHWADPASVELLGALLHRPPAAQVLLALAVRPRQMGERLSAPPSNGRTAPARSRASSSSALSPDEARELVGDGGDATGLYEDSGGNPFYLEQLARSADLAATPARPPTSLRSQASTSRLRSPQRSRRSSRCSPSRHASSSRAPPSQETPSTPSWRPRPPGPPRPRRSTRSTSCCAWISFARPTFPGASASGTRSSAARYTSRCPAAGGSARTNAAPTRSPVRGSPASAIAHHVERSARQGDEAAVALLQEAGEAAAPRAPASAARWFAAALRLLPAAAPSDRRVELLLARSEALAATGQLGESHAALLESMNIVPPEAESLRVRLTAACARVEHLLGRYKEAHAHLETALAELRDPDSAQGVELMIELAGDSLYHGDYDAMRAWASRAVDAAAPLDDQALIAAALAVRALASAVGGRAAEGQAYSAEAATLIDGLADDELDARLDALAHLATAEFYLEHFAAAGSHAERALRIGRATGKGDLFPLIVPMLGGSLWVRGRMAEAGEVLDGAIAAARLVDNPQGLAWNLFNRSYAAFAAGDIDVALATAKEAFELAQGLDPGPVPAHAAVALAYARFETGHPERSAELLVEYAGGKELRLIGGGWRARYLELLTRSFLAAGRRDEAEHAAAAAQACAEAVGLPMAGAHGSPRRRGARSRRRRASAAAERALNAAAALEEVGNVFDAANVAAARRPSARRRRASATAQQPSWSSQPLRSIHSARTATDCRPNGNSGSSDARFTAAPARARETDPPSTRSPSASSRSHGSSSTARPTLRSRPSSSSARRPSKPTCETRSASSASHRASKWHAPSSAPTARCRPRPN